MLTSQMYGRVSTTPTRGGNRISDGAGAGDYDAVLQRAEAERSSSCAEEALAA